MMINIYFKEANERIIKNRLIINTLFLILSFCVQKELDLKIFIANIHLSVDFIKKRGEIESIRYQYSQIKIKKRLH